MISWAVMPARLNMRKRATWAPCAFLVGLAGLGYSARSVSAGVAAPSQPLTGRVPGLPVSSHRAPGSVAGDDYRITVFPNLEAGQPGWGSFLTYTLHGRAQAGGGGGAGYPTDSSPVFGGGELTSYSPGKAPNGDIVGYVLTGSSVAAVRFGRRTVRTFASSKLPVGDRAAVFFLAASAPTPLPDAGLGLPGKTTRLLALDTKGHILSSGLPRYTRSTSTFWQAPTAGRPSYAGPTSPPPGACELSQHGPAGLTAEFGHVIQRIQPVHSATGEVFLSCIDTEYYFHGWPLEAAVLLDATHPGRTLRPIPRADPLAGHGGTIEVPGGSFPGSLTARRVGEAWLVVQGGASLAQRTQVLDALVISKLALAG